ncbi:MAG: TRCF domain-containing protein [Oscillospiraceae bacterium]
MGYDMYLQLLEDAVLEEQGEERKKEPVCTADLAVTANIAEAYVPDGEQRMDLYRRMAAVRSRADADDLLDEIVDRYGDPPKGVMNLLAVALLRARAAAAGVADISQRARSCSLPWRNLTLPPSQISARSRPGRAGCGCCLKAEKPILAVRLAKAERPSSCGSNLSMPTGSAMRA